MSVVDFGARLSAKRAAQGEASFIVCPCQEHVEESAGFAPVAQHDAAGAFVSALVCMACGEAIDLNGGRLE